MNDKPLMLYPLQVQKLLGVGRDVYYQMSKLPDFPKPRNPLGKRAIYLREEIEEWVRNLDPETRSDQENE